MVFFNINLILFYNDLLFTTTFLLHIADKYVAEATISLHHKLYTLDLTRKTQMVAENAKNLKNVH